MADPLRPPLLIRPEIHRLMIMCEYLLTSINDTPLNEDERHAIECYRAELEKALNAERSDAGETLSLFRL
jgi:hypothetical protein